MGTEAVSSSLLESKLRLPRLPTRPLARAHLSSLLDAGSLVPLTLVAAPPGYGKTTLVASWLAGRTPAGRFAWLSLGESEREPTRFWTYLLTAVERACPGTAVRALAQLQTGVDAAVGELLNELSVLPDDLTVVLDDYHLCDCPAVRAGMTLLLDHLPPQLHLVIIARADPNLPLSTLRARGELLEVRASDLRFTSGESATYLNEINGLDLDATSVAALDQRTEGWAAAIQLAALSLRGRPDRAGFIAEFAGDDRFVLDYLADEVLGRVTGQTRRFLLQTSILGRLTGPLCDAVTAATDGRAMLESLERQNLFLIPLDDQRRWYRYHHLFADVLHAHLLDEMPDDVATLHRRASDWLAEHGDPEAAIGHALAAGHTDRAADLVELAIPQWRRRRREALIRQWVDKLPTDAVETRPVLAVGVVGALMASNEFDGVERRLEAIEAQLEHPEELVVVDQWEFGRIPAVIETYRAALALVGGRLAATTAHAGAALALAAGDDLLSIAAASALAGLAAWAQGDLDTAYAAYAVSADQLGRAGHLADVLGCTIALADIAIAQGRLGEAGTSVHSALGAAEAAGGPEPVRGTADMYVALSVLDLERHDLPAAARHLRQADELGERAALPQNAYRWRVALARLRAAEGDTASALDLLDEAERVYIGDFSPDVQPIAATRARVLAATGRTAEALDWAHRSGLLATDPASYLHEYAQVSLVRVQLAARHEDGRDLDDVTALLERLLSAAEAGGRRGSLVEMLVLLARLREATGEPAAALAALERALRLAEPEDHRGPFIGDGPAIATMLAALGERDPAWRYLGDVRHAVQLDGLRRSGDGATLQGRVPTQPSGLSEPLSVRELEVLRYLRSELDGPAIARALGVSLSTVRTHTQHVYTKLGVNSRLTAVRRAHQLGLFSPRRAN